MDIITRKNIIKAFLFLFLLSSLLLFWLKQQCWFDRTEYGFSGLGLSRQQWESLHGNYTWHDSAEYLYKDSKFEYFVSYDNCRIVSFRVYPLKEHELSSQEIKNQALSLIPYDSNAVESDNETYFSKSLMKRFSNENQRSAGTITIEYLNNRDIDGFGIWSSY